MSMFSKIRSLIKPKHVVAAAAVAATAGAGAATAVAVRKRIANAPRLSAGTLLMTQGESYLLEVTGTDEAVYWESTDPQVADVSAEGLVTAEAADASMATIVGFVGKKALECEVVVVPEEALRRRNAAYEPVDEAEDDEDTVVVAEEELSEEEL